MDTMLQPTLVARLCGARANLTLVSAAGSPWARLEEPADALCDRSYRSSAQRAVSAGPNLVRRETARQDPTLSMLEKLAKVLGMKVVGPGQDETGKVRPAAALPVAAEQR